MASKGTRFEWANEPGLRRELAQMTERGQYALDNQVIRDTTPYVPYAQGPLAQSVHSASEVGAGVVAWQTPYAAAQYYGMPNKAGGVHPKATMKWFEVAKQANKGRWIEISKKAARRL